MLHNKSSHPAVSWSCMSKSAIDQFTKCVALGKQVFSIPPPEMFLKCLIMTACAVVICTQIIFQSWHQSKYELTLG